MSSSSKGKQPPKAKPTESRPRPPKAVPDDSAVLDTSGAGGPFILPAAQIGGPVGASVVGPAPSDEELIVEVEFAPGAASISSALTTNMAGFLGAGGGAAPPSTSGLSLILQQYDAQEARPVFTPEQIQADEARTATLREAAVLGAASSDQVSALELPPLKNFVRLRFPAGTPAAEVTAALKRLSEVTRAVVVPGAAPPAFAFSAPVPTDPFIGSDPIAKDPNSQVESQWYLHRTRVLPAWQYTRGADVVVADIDWGFRTTHREFEDAIELTHNAVDDGQDVTQGEHAGHGTAVLGIAGARANNSGMAGYAPEAALWAIQAAGSPNQPTFKEPWAEAIDYVHRTPAGGRRKVIILEVQTNPGYGNYEQIPSVHRAIRAAIADGCVVCVAAGNGDRPADRTDSGEPFDPTGSILVGATAYDDKLNKRAWFSNYGSRVVVSAPGDKLHDLTCGQAADDKYRNDFGGTSGATPKVAGTVALMLSVNPELSHNDIRDILAGTGSPLTEDPGKPIGVFLNAEAAVAEALRRRSKAQVGEIVLTPEGQPVLEAPAAQPLHGVRRRRGQMVLPEVVVPTEFSEPISWIWDAAVGVAEGVAEGVADVFEGAMPPASPGEQPPLGDKTLRVFRESVEGTLTQQDRILIVAQAIEMLDKFYVHRPLKEAIHAVRPIQRLRVLQRRLQQQTNIPEGEQDELMFHNTMTQIFNSMRDLHTGYQLPRPYRDYIAYLPFEVAPFYEGGQRRYLVTRVLSGYAFADSKFGPGAELLYWNGMAIERAIRANADQTAGGNEAARHARGVSALTLRPMNTALPPDADFVDLEFLPPGADASDTDARRQMRQHWFIRYTSSLGGGEAVASAPAMGATAGSGAAPPAPPPDITFGAHSALDLARESTARSSDLLFNAPPAPAPTVAPPNAASAPTTSVRNLALAAVLGLDTAADAVREARQLIFGPTALQQRERANAGDQSFGTGGSASPESVETDTVTAEEVKVEDAWKAAFRARTVDINGTTYGHIQIRTFYFEDADGFVQEFIRLLGKMPETGLILDVRGNGGGNIWAAERLLQTMTAAEIEPERMLFIATPGTIDLCRNNPATSQIPLDPWLRSLEEAVETGAVYSHAFPLTTKDSCNAIGQQYYGPVVLIVDGNCYSATDMFAAGFQDHEIGKILGVSTSTGAGGANVWEHWLLNQVLPSGGGLKLLPNQAGMRVAIRQCLRVGRRVGSLLEDFGVAPDAVHPPTREDVMDGDRILLARAAEILAKEPEVSIKMTIGALDTANPALRQITITTRGLKRLDFFVDGRPRGSHDVNAASEATLTASVRIGATLRLVGYKEPTDGTPATRYQKQVR